jgi:uncharacterized protein GlcG (DUF336 family)
MERVLTRFVAGVAIIAAVAMSFALIQQLVKSATLQSLTAEDISVDEALLVAQGALDECKKTGAPTVSVAVVDNVGGVRFLLRGDGATPEMADNARKKAYTARTFRMATSDWIERTSDDAVDEKGVKRDLGGQRFLDDTLAEPGGMPIIMHGQPIGGVGVTGAKDPMMDEDCAKAGVAAIADQFF